MAADRSMPLLVEDDSIKRNLLKRIGFSDLDDKAGRARHMRGEDIGLIISDSNMEPMTG